MLEWIEAHPVGVALLSSLGGILVTAGLAFWRLIQGINRNVRNVLVGIVRKCGRDQVIFEELGDLKGEPISYQRVLEAERRALREAGIEEHTE